jgi:hypothetical protein
MTTHHATAMRIVLTFASAFALVLATTVATTTVPLTQTSGAAANDLWRKSARAMRTDSSRGVPSRLLLVGQLTNAAWTPPSRPLRVEFLGTSSFVWQETGANGPEGFTVSQRETEVRRAGSVATAPTAGHRNFRIRWAQLAVVYLGELPRGCTPQFSSVGSRVIDRRQAVGLEILGPCSARYRAWFDTETSGLLALDSEEAIVTGSASIPSPGDGRPTQSPEPSSGRTVQATLVPTDFRVVDGLRMPFKVSITDDRARRTIDVSSATVTW